MVTVPLNVGLDYSDLSVEVAIVDAAGLVLANKPIANDAAEIAAFVAPFGPVVRAGIECGTGAANLADELAQRFGWNIDLAASGIVSRMKQNPDKTDFQDAHVLGDLVRVGYLPKVWLPPEWVRELRRLVRYREQLVQNRRQAKQKIRAILRDARQRPATKMSAWTKAWWVWVDQIAVLSEQGRWVLNQLRREIERKTQDIGEVEKRMEHLTKDDAVTAKLLAQHGVGPVTAYTLRAEVGSFTRFQSGKQLARYCGVTPCNASSGTRQADSGLIRAANGSLRTVLIETAHRLARLEPRWAAYKEQLKRRGKPGSVIAGAIANRWVRGLFHVMTKEQTTAA